MIKTASYTHILKKQPKYDSIIGVPILVGRSGNSIAAMLSCIFSGLPFSPINYKQPEIRLKKFQKSLHSNFILSGLHESEVFSDKSFNLVFPTAEYTENQTSEQKYVNISDRNGRRILNNKNCEKLFYFYGGSSTFGYNVTDYQAFSSYFKEILSNNHSSKNYCVYNFGRAGYASSQENILFQKHLLRNRFKAGYFIFFVDGHN